MVFCGKPSKGCAPCRSRRTKCDLARPSCSQCCRAGRICHGYRDLNAASFRDQSKSVRDNAIILGQRSSLSSPAVTDNALTPSSSFSEFPPKSRLGSVSDILTVYPSLPYPAEERAATFFFNNYVWDDSPSSRGYFNYLPKMWNDLPSESPLRDIVTALGLVGLANSLESSQMTNKASSCYVKALRSVNTTLQSEEVAASDSTIVTIVLLGLYEINTCTAPRSMRSWSNHINGAVALLKLRGIEQLKSQIGLRVFIQLRTQAILNCLQRHVSVPDIILEWSIYARQFESVEEAHNSILCEIVIKFCDLRALVALSEGLVDSAMIISTALDIELELSEWADQLPVQYFYNIVTMRTRSSSVFADYYHEYTNIWIATTWNHYRSVRILVNELVIEHITYLQSQAMQPGEDEDPVIAALYRTRLNLSKSILLQLTQDICASIPMYIDGSNLGASTSPLASVSRAASGNLLLWPLYTAAATDSVSDVMRLWVVDRLKTIARVMGIQQANVLACVLSMRKDIDAWRLEDR